jgi:hypothetical protein
MVILKIISSLYKHHWAHGASGGYRFGRFGYCQSQLKLVNLPTLFRQLLISIFSVKSNKSVESVKRRSVSVWFSSIVMKRRRFVFKKTAKRCRLQCFVSAQSVSVRFGLVG